MPGNWLHSVLADAAGIRGREVIPKVLTVANPAAGSDWSVTVPGGSLWLPQGITAQLVTSAVVANRNVELRVGDSDNRIVAAVPPQSSSPASIQHQFYWQSCITSAYNGGANRQGIPLPTCPVLGGWVIRPTTFNIDVGDQWSLIILYVLEIEETPYDIEVARDLSRLAGSRTDSVPQFGLEA